MCGRFVVYHDLEQIRRYLPFDRVNCEVTASYNVAPRQQILAIYRVDNVNVLDRLHWGLVPFWAKDISIGNKMINARSETVATKPSFREAFRRRRCLIPTDGFLEWLRHESRMCDCLAEPSGQTCRPIGSTLRGMAMR